MSQPCKACYTDEPFIYKGPGTKLSILPGKNKHDVYLTCKTCGHRIGPYSSAGVAYEAWDNMFKNDELPF